MLPYLYYYNQDALRPIRFLNFMNQNPEIDGRYFLIAENRNQKSETQNPKSEIRKRKTEIRNQKSEIRNRKTENGKRKTEIRNQTSEIGKRKSEIRNQKSNIRNKKSVCPKARDVTS